MTASASSDFASRSLGEIAATLPGATAIFRRNKLDFCCGGKASLAEAANEKGQDLSAIETELAQLVPGPGEAPEETDALIGYILERFHEVHRRELPELLFLANKVERRHADHAACPAGLTALLDGVAVDMEAHLQKEEQILFPMMRRGGHPMIGQPIGVMLHEHDNHGQNLDRIFKLTNDLTVPADGCESWQALYAGLRKFADDLMMHIHLENNVLFPRFA